MQHSIFYKIIIIIILLQVHCRMAAAIISMYFLNENNMGLFSTFRDIGYW